MLELYYFPTATCGYKARLTLAEKGVEFTHRVLDRDAGELVTPEYLKLNPNAVVPTMVHDGHVLIESSIIMVYTDDAFDGPSLRPADPLRRARVAAWLKEADDAYLPALGAITYGIYRRKQVLTKSDADLAIYYTDIPDPDRRAQRRAVVEQGIDAAQTQAGILTLNRMLADLEDALAETPWLSGADYGLADAALTPFLSRIEELHLDWMWQDMFHVARWWDGVRNRPSFNTVFAAFPDPDRKAGLRLAGEEVYQKVKDILATKA